MANICREQRHARIDVDPLAVPTKDRPDDERVPEVVHPRLGSWDTCLAKEPRERAVHVVVNEPRSDARDEETW